MAAQPEYSETTHRRWPDPENGPWLVTVYWARRDGRPVPVGMEMVPASPKDAADVVLTTSALRDLRIAEIVVEDREQLKYVSPTSPDFPSQVEGMRPSTVRRLRRAAAYYLEAWRAGDPPRQAVALRMNISEDAAGSLVRRAREAGFLPPTAPGVPQG